LRWLIPFPTRWLATEAANRSELGCPKSPTTSELVACVRIILTVQPATILVASVQGFLNVRSYWSLSPSSQRGDSCRTRLRRISVVKRCSFCDRNVTLARDALLFYYGSCVLVGNASAANGGGGTIVGRLVPMTIRSGGCCIEDIRIVGLFVSAAVGSANVCGRNQFATNSSPSSDVPTQAMYCLIGKVISRHSNPGREQTPESLIVRNSTWLLLELRSF
jgi:hypothetical protein